MPAPATACVDCRYTHLYIYTLLNHAHPNPPHAQVGGAHGGARLACSTGSMDTDSSCSDQHGPAAAGPACHCCGKDGAVAPPSAAAAAARSPLRAQERQQLMTPSPTTANHHRGGGAAAAPAAPPTAARWLTYAKRGGPLARVALAAALEAAAPGGCRAARGAANAASALMTHGAAASAAAEATRAGAAIAAAYGVAELAPSSEALDAAVWRRYAARRSLGAKRSRLSMASF
jgi:hypothetical protein